MSTRTRWARRSHRAIGTALFALAVTVAGPADAAEGGGGLFDWIYPLGETADVARLSDKPVPYKVVPTRPPLALELGCDFLGKGNIPAGIELPGGAVWTPCLWVFGTLRTALQTYEGVGTPGRNTEWANRLDMFVNLQLTSTEKCLVGISPLDKNEFTNFTRYSFESNQNLEGWQNETGVFVRAAFCEGDFGSLFPNLDPMGTELIDWGFSFGRQQITFQEGIMINDVLDGAGIVRNNLHLPGFSNIRATFFTAFESIDRGTPVNRLREEDGWLHGLFLQADTAATTWAFDFVTIQDDDNDSGGDGYYFGVAATQRSWGPWDGVGTVNTTYRVNASVPEGDDNAFVSDGVLLTAEISWTPHASDDIVYINGGWGISRYTQAAREPIVGGPLAALGISFASNSLGNFLSELNAFGTQGVIGVMGYQAFWNAHRQNLVLEVAGVKDTTRSLFSSRGDGGDGAAFTAQYQHAVGQRVQLQLDAFYSFLEGRDNGSGARFEVLVQF